MDERRCPECGATILADAPGGLCPTCLLQLVLDAEAAEPNVGDAIASFDAPAMPTFGPYRTVRLLGEGGMGLVYLAEQAAPVRRSVALKIVKPGVSSRLVLARFESERQALALLQHPAIATIYDAGATPDGHPFFAMEYVAGPPITRYCDEHRLSIADRLELFLQVCAAVQHAHQKGIIHRDLKPSNLLVTRQDERPLVKVIDFGVAKAVGQRLTDLTLDTHHGSVVGTPAYMSPEQAGATPFDVDTRTDIYSLGVVLYELLVGLRPFEAEELREAALGEMLRVIREVDPPRFSSRISSADDGTASEIAQYRRLDVKSLARRLRGDLEWITLRSLEKEPARRYASASELAADLRRHLHDEPVSAGPPRLSYRAWKFVRKHKAAVGAMFAVLAALAIGLVISLTMYVRANEAMALAQRQGYIANIAATDLALQAQSPREAQRRLLQADSSIRDWEWRHLSLAADSSLARFDTNTSGIRSVNFDASGRQIVWHTDSEVYVVDLASRTVASSKTAASLLGRSPDGRRGVVSPLMPVAPGPTDGDASKAGDAELRDLRSGATIASLGHQSPSPVVFSPDGRRVVVGDWLGRLTNLGGGTIRLTESLGTTLRIHEASTGREVARVDFADSPRGVGQSVNITQARRILQSVTGFAAFTFSPDGRRLAFCQDSTLHQWDSSTGRALVTTRVDGVDDLSSPAYTEDGTKIMCFRRNDAQVEWDASTGRLLDIKRRQLSGWPLAVSPDGRRLALLAGGVALLAGGRILIVDAATGAVSVELRGHTEDVRTAAFSPDGRLLVSGGYDAVRVWSTEADRAVTRVRARAAMVTSLVFHPNGRQIVAGNVAKEIEIWDLESRQMATLSGHRSPVVSVALSRDGQTLVSGGQDGTIHRWKLGDARPAQTIGDPHSRPLQALALDPQHLHVVAATQDNAVRVWNSQTGRLVTRLREADKHAGAVAVTSNGSHVAVGTESGVLMVWDTTNWGLVHRINAHPGTIVAAVFSPDGRTMASAGRDGPIRLWDARSGRELGTFVGHEAEASTIAFSPDGRRLISGSSDATIRVWDAQHFDSLLTLRHDGPVTSVAWSADGTRVAASSTGGTILVWNTRTSRGV